VLPTGRAGTFPLLLPRGRSLHHFRLDFFKNLPSPNFGSFPFQILVRESAMRILIIFANGTVFLEMISRKKFVLIFFFCVTVLLL